MTQTNKIEFELMRLKDLTKRTGVIHEAQQIQLKMWALFLSPKKGSFKVRIDLDHSTVFFEFKSLIKKYIEHYPQALARSVRHLLGSEWVTKVVVKGKTIFTSKRIEPVIRKELEVETEIIPWRERLFQ